MCTLYTYTNTYMPIFGPSGFSGPSRCLILTPGLTSEYPICTVCVCVCVYTHLHPHTLPPALKIEKTQTTPLSCLLSKRTPHAKQQVPSETSWTPPPSFPNAEWTNCTYMSAYAHPVASVYANVYADVHKICLTYTTHMHMHGAYNTCRNACKLSAKNAHALLHARLCNGAEDSLPWKLLRTYLESCAGIVQAVVCRPPCLLSRRNRLPDAVRSRNPSKCTLAHDAVADAVSQKHYLIIRVGAGLIQLVYGSHLKHGHRAHPSHKSIFTILFAGFSWYWQIKLFLWISKFLKKA